MKNKKNDYKQLEFIYSYEKNVSMPLKWAMIIVCFVLTYYLNKDIISEPKFFNGYILVVSMNLFFSILYYFKNLKYIKIISFFSLAQDIFFVSFLLQFTGGIKSLLNIVYCIFFIRATINYPSVKDMLIVAFIIFSPIYFYGIRLSEGNFLFLTDKYFLSQYIFLILVVFSSFGVVYIVNKQKQEIEKNLSEIKNLQVQLVQAEKLSALGRLAGGVAHEINNPLVSILGFTQLMLRDIPFDDPKRDDFLKIEKAAIRCRRIVESLLKFSRQTSSKLQDVDINSIIDESLSLLHHQLKNSDVKIIKELNNNIPKIKVDPSHISQVFVNIVLNAYDAMSNSGGLLTIKTENIKEANNNYIKISFSDTGVGIEEENINKIFEPFYTTKDINKGTGLGLAISYGLIKQYGGDIKVKSKVNEGTTFEVLLPY